MMPEWLDNYLSLHPSIRRVRRLDETRSRGLMYSNSREFQMVEGLVARGMVGCECGVLLKVWRSFWI